MRVLIACEFSGIVREAFKARGHDAWSCDLLDTEIPGNHIKDDVLKHLYEGWDLMIAHPPCTYLCNSGVRWLWNSPGIWNNERYIEMCKAVWFFRKFIKYALSGNRIVIENPIPHKYAELPPYHQIIQPWMFGHSETKATCLWLYGVTKLKPTNIVEGREGRVWKETPSSERWKNRSRTYQGIANAMANQWG
jgi:hypothetical protein